MVQFVQGDRVRDTYQKKIGIITGRNRPFGNMSQWEVQFEDGSRPFIRESDLEPMSDDEDMFSLFACARFTGIQEIRRNIYHKRLDGTLTNIFYSMRNSTADFLLYQFKPVMKFIESTTGRLLIADEVGLGKTIESLYIWKELLVRENAKRLLIVVPAQLRQKWHDDIQRFFNIHTDIVNTSQLLDKLTESLSMPNDSLALIVSLQGIRCKDTENTTANSHANIKLNDFFEKRQVYGNEPLFDLVIIDEAHHLRNSETASFKTGERLRDISRYMILLSATPIQTHSINLYNLLRLLSPEEFYNANTFEVLLEENRPLISFSNALRRNETKSTLQSFYTKAKPYLLDNLQKSIEQVLNGQNITPQDRMRLFFLMQDTSFYSQYFTRTRKRDIQKNRILRESNTLNFIFTPEEAGIYKRVTAHLKNQAKGASQAAVFSLIARQRQMASCLPAAVEHWFDNDVMTDLLYEDYEDFDYTNDSYLQKIQINDEQLKRELFTKEVVSGLSKNDSKYKKLLECVNKIKKDNEKRKIIIFSFFRYTVNYLHDRLNKEGFRCEKIMGGVDDKNEIIERFRESSAINILVSSEVGAEGIDLQFADTLINYDLPWNPMRVEQRIGRIDRYGQKEKKINIINFKCNETIEDRVLDLLYEKIEVFKHSIGDIEEIIGKEIQDISFELFTSKLSDDARQRQAEQSIEAMINQKLLEVHLEEEAGLSAAFSDVIMENIDSADKGKRYIRAVELITYTEDFFEKNYNGTRIEKKSDTSLEISLSLDARLDLSEYKKTERMGRTDLGIVNGSVLCLFNLPKDEKTRKKRYEFIDINHPLIKWMREKNKQSVYNNNMNSCSAIHIPLSPDVCLPAGYYAYYIELWEAEGYKKIKELKYYLCDIDNNANIISGDDAENCIISILEKGSSFYEVEYQADIAKASTALKTLQGHAQGLFQNFDSGFTEKNILLCQRQKQYLVKTHQQKVETIKRVIADLRADGRSIQIINMYEKRLENIEAEFPVQLERLERQQKCSCRPTDIAVGLLKVGG